MKKHPIIAPLLLVLLCVLSFAASAQTPTHVWTRVEGDVVPADADPQTVSAISVVNGTNNVVMVGGFEGAIALGAGLTSAGSSDIFIATYNASGSLLWAKSLGSTGFDTADAVATNFDGEIFIGGMFTGTIDLGGGPLVSVGGYDMFLAKFDVDGDHLWSKRFGDTASPQRISDLDVDVGGYVVICAGMPGSADFGGGVLTSAGSYDVFVARFNSAGTHQWSKRFGDAGVQVATSIATGISNEVVITGYINGTTNFGGSNLTSLGGSDIFLAKFNSAGTHQWSKRFGDAASSQAGEDVELDALSGVILLGDFEGTANFGGSTLTADGEDTFVARFSNAGTHSWSRLLPGEGDSFAAALAIDPTSLYVAGGFEGTIDLGAGPMTAVGYRDVFFGRLHLSNGSFLWGARYGDAYGVTAQFGRALAVDGAGDILLAGSFEGLLSLGYGSGPFEAPDGSSQSDVFLAKFRSQAVEPVITTIHDVPNDNGGQVLIEFARSGYDTDGVDLAPTLSYEIYLRVGGDQASAHTRTATAESWLLMKTVPAHARDAYLTIAETLYDSQPPLEVESLFRVRAVTASRHIYFDGPVAAGESMDNLAPRAPSLLVWDGARLSWSGPADAAHYTVYGSRSAAWGADAVQIASTTDTFADLSQVSWPGYFVTATDRAGNESVAARAPGGNSGSAAPVSLPLSISAYPNPFNPETTVRYTLPSAGRVTVDVVDARGAMVAVLTEARAAAGAHTARWNGVDREGNPVASGVYFARVRHAGASQSYKLLLLK